MMRTTPLPMKEVQTVSRQTQVDPKKQFERRVKAEVKKLEQVLKDVPEDQVQMVSGLVRRAAYMRITLEDYEADMTENGYTEPFQQSEKCDPYDRERPVVRLYNSMVKNYAAVMRQIFDLAPSKPATPTDPEYEKFFGGGKGG